MTGSAGAKRPFYHCKPACTLRLQVRQIESPGGKRYIRPRPPEQLSREPHSSFIVSGKCRWYRRMISIHGDEALSEGFFQESGEVAESPELPLWSIRRIYTP